MVWSGFTPFYFKSLLFRTLFLVLITASYAVPLTYYLRLFVPTLYFNLLHIITTLLATYVCQCLGAVWALWHFAIDQQLRRWQHIVLIAIQFREMFLKAIRGIMAHREAWCAYRLPRRRWVLLGLPVGLVTLELIQLFAVATYLCGSEWRHFQVVRSHQDWLVVLKHLVCASAAGKHRMWAIEVILLWCVLAVAYVTSMVLLRVVQELLVLLRLIYI